MPVRPATIDLGVLPRDQRPAIEPDWPGWPGWHRLRRTLVRHWRRAVRAALPATLTMLTVTAAAAPTGPWLVPHFTVPIEATPAVTDRTLYAVGGGGTDGASTLAAYRLADGTQRWRAPVPEPGRVSLHGGTVVVSPRFGQSTTAFDASTGRWLWHRRASLLAEVGAGRLLLHRDVVTATSWQTEYILVEADTGRSALTLPLTPDSSVVSPQDTPSHVVELTAEGRLVSYDLATGAIAAEVTPTPPPTQLYPVGPLVIVAHTEPDRTVLRAHDPATLRRLWSVTGAPDHHSWLAWCKPVVCLVDAGRWRAVDPATGAVMWSPDWDGGLVAQFTAVGQLPSGSSGHLLVQRLPGPHRSESWVVDAALGRAVRDLAGWHYPHLDSWQAPPRGQSGPGGARPFATAGTWEPLLTWHHHGSAWFARLLPDQRVELLGPLDAPHPDLACAIGPAELVCVASEAGVAEVWGVRR